MYGKRNKRKEHVKKLPSQTEAMRQMMPRERLSSRPDKLLAALHEPLPADTVSKIIELHKQKEPRSKIAKKLGLSKLQVNDVIMKNGGGAA